MRTVNDTPIADLPIPASPLASMIAHARDHLCNVAALRAGVTLEIAFDMHALLSVNAGAVAAGTWEPILPAAHPDCRTLAPSNAYWIRGVDTFGDVVTVQAGPDLAQLNGDPTAPTWLASTLLDVHGPIRSLWPSFTVVL